MVDLSNNTTMTQLLYLLKTTTTAVVVFFLFAVVQAHTNKKILVVGSANADTFLPVDRLPIEGENLTLRPGQHPVVDVPGGKGCTQAVAVARLLENDQADGGGDNNDTENDSGVVFWGQLGDDGAGKVIRSALDAARVQSQWCGVHQKLPTGRGYVFLSASGQVSAVVSGGSNLHGWNGWNEAWKAQSTTTTAVTTTSVEGEIRERLEGVECILLQREVPEYVNLLVAHIAKEMNPNIIILQDVGGEDRPISSEMLRLCDYVVPNESELLRLIESNEDSPLSKDELILKCAQELQRRGANNVLVTRGSKGSMLLTEDGKILHQPSIPVHGNVVDETGAGDCYRAAFAVSLMERRHSLQKCMQFASAAGSCSVEVHGAVPSAPSRSDAMDRLLHATVLDIPRGDGQVGFESFRGGSSSNNEDGDGDFPFLIGSRLNSMKDRPELWDGPLNNPKDFVRRQATISGLTCVDFNYPQHFHSWSVDDSKEALLEAGLVAGAVCLRYPSKFTRGAMNHPETNLRQEAIDLTKQAAEAAIKLGCNEVVVWSAFDGYDYPFQVDYDEKWDQLVHAFRECCDAFPSIKFSLEYKPTDENTRFFTVPTTGAALLFVEDVDRPNMGLTLDVGHMLMAGENPGQSIAMVGRKQKLFGIQLNDGFTRLAAEDGLMFGSVHPSMALEIMFQLQRTKFRGHLYFDTFPQRSDPVKEAKYNIQQAKRFYHAAQGIDERALRVITAEHDAVGALEVVNAALNSGSHSMPVKHE